MQADAAACQDAYPSIDFEACASVSIQPSATLAPSSYCAGPDNDLAVPASSQDCSCMRCGTLMTADRRANTQVQVPSPTPNCSCQVQNNGTFQQHCQPSRRPLAAGQYVRELLATQLPAGTHKHVSA
jgi:hypothetical protein